MLAEVGKRVTGCLRRSDFIARKLPPGYENVMATGGDAVVRLGGDEFIILLSEIRENGDAAVVAQRVLENLVGEPFVFEGQEVKVTSVIQWGALLITFATAVTVGGMLLVGPSMGGAINLIDVLRIALIPVVMVVSAAVVLFVALAWVRWLGFRLHYHLPPKPSSL